MFLKLPKILLTTILFYFLVLVQTSFLVHFDIWGIAFNFVLFLIIIWNILEKHNCYYGLFAAGTGGFFLDIFSSGLLGFNFLILFLLSGFIKLFLRSYVRIPFFEKI